MTARQKKALPKPPPFQISKQRIERVILTGTPDHIHEAIEWATKRGYGLSQVGPKLIGQATKLSDKRRFIILAEKAVRQ